MNTFYFADSNFLNTDYMSDKCSIDIEIGNEKNDFEVTIPISEYDSTKHCADGYIYCPGTELGGRLCSPSIDTAAKTVKMQGIAFRGLLEERVLTVPAGQDYRFVSGELNTGLANMFGRSFYGGLFRVSTNDTGIVSGNVQMNRYANYLESAEQFLGTKGNRLKIEIMESQTGDNVSFYAELSAVDIVDHSDYIENSQDGGIDFKISKATSFPYTHAILLGKGELRNRLVVNVSIAKDGSLTKITSIPEGKNVRVYKYDNSNVESEADLISQATENIKQKIETDSQSITITDFMVDLGDLVGGRDYVTGTRIVEPVTSVVYKQKTGVESYDYKIGVKKK